jgi:hypothetical protein
LPWSGSLSPIISDSHRYMDRFCEAPSFSIEPARYSSMQIITSKRIQPYPDLAWSNSSQQLLDDIPNYLRASDSPLESTNHYLDESKYYANDHLLCEIIPETVQPLIKSSLSPSTMTCGSRLL